ncbi:DUF1653 domain-containing protein [Patescibacteria group bacterium]|nr:DUF1653 domain-containing protein [Patescibacteria group bacterium]MBU1682688.1 DUF1653 domain-containing protein [Patescibacteria group bacterium]MBU1935509.1 DUF1653 domain-containing protein [Patescibacteria group bacterium]
MIKKSLIRAGTYKHYKGGLYKVISIAKHTETGEDMVVYRSLDKERQLWVRPLEIFREKVKVEGKLIPRFERTGN